MHSEARPVCQVELCGTRISKYNGINDTYSSRDSRTVQFKKSSFSGSKAFMTDQNSTCLSLNLSSSSSSNPFNMHIPKDLSNMLTATIIF